MDTVKKVALETAKEFSAIQSGCNGKHRGIGTTHCPFEMHHHHHHHHHDSRCAMFKKTNLGLAYISLLNFIQQEYSEKLVNHSSSEKKLHRYQGILLQCHGQL